MRTEDKTIDQSESPHLYLFPISHEQTNNVIFNGWAGAEPLPVCVYNLKDNNSKTYIQSAWKIPKQFHKQLKERMRDDNVVLSVVIAIDNKGGFAEISITIPSIIITNMV